ncbi:MAG: hypothetical protein KKG06_09840, partial [Bacteroidetes bacterium]|nr:hypothetical protein [Bacteroidota bacterium]
MHFHNIFETGFTARYRPWKIIFKKECASRKEALELEKKIKTADSLISKLKYSITPGNIDTFLIKPCKSVISASPNRLFEGILQISYE